MPLFLETVYYKVGCLFWCATSKIDLKLVNSPTLTICKVNVRVHQIFIMLWNDTDFSPHVTASFEETHLDSEIRKRIESVQIERFDIAILLMSNCLRNFLGYWLYSLHLENLKTSPIQAYVKIGYTALLP